MASRGRTIMVKHQTKKNSWSQIPPTDTFPPELETMHPQSDGTREFSAAKASHDP